MRPPGILLLIVGSLAVARAAEAPPPARPPAVGGREFFEKKVRPLLVDGCYRCHSRQAKKLKGGLLLDSRAGLLKGGDSGPAVVPGHPEQSLLIRAVGYQSESLQMPPGGKLPARDVAVLEEWVRRGAPFPGPNDAGPAQAGTNLAEGRKFWSFQPPRAVTPPEVRDRRWPRRRIDSFVLAELEKRGLRPSAPASRRALIRRATFDLIGLPPTPEEVEAFVNDPAPDAYPRLVERLLGSPRYGERWGRLWLDLARYCDVAEPWAEGGGQAWLYRDWVVRAFNEDLPYDRFVQCQLAADQMPDADRRDLAALGFLGLSPVYWKELQLDHNVIKTVVAEEWEERIQTVTGTFLGLTAACARCHDHKFDPITQQDYYALAGVFASTRQADRMVGFRSSVRDFRLPPPSPTAAVEAAMAVQSQMLCAPGVEDASLYVLPDGPHRTRLDYRPGVAQDVAMQVRGNPSNPGPVVPRRFPAVLSPDPPRPFARGSGRLELARAIVTEGAPLASRVIVNRVWKQHFGAGLVETPSDFGRQGARPSHPELLDDLAARFMAPSPLPLSPAGERGRGEGGWSIKWLHREIMLSATYQQASSRSEAGSRKSEGIRQPEIRTPASVDPDNRLLWRMNRRSLEIEAWRDAMLAVAGTLELRQGGPSIDLGDPANRRRTIYGTVKRRELHDLLRLYDFPDPKTHSPARLPTITPLQQLFVLNSPFIQQQSAALARRLQAEVPRSVEGRVRRAYRLLYGREATEGQVRLAVEFLTEGKPAGGGGEELWREYAQVLLGSNEFLFVD